MLEIRLSVKEGDAYDPEAKVQQYGIRKDFEENLTLLDDETRLKLREYLEAMRGTPEDQEGP